MFSYWMNGDQILNIKNLRNEGMVKDEVRNVYILSSPIVVLAQFLMLNFLYTLYIKNENRFSIIEKSPF